MKPAPIAQEYFVKYKYLSTAFPAVLCGMAGFLHSLHNTVAQGCVVPLY